MTTPTDKFTFKKAEKTDLWMRTVLIGPAGAGKTYTGLSILTALCKRVAVVDTEYGSARKLADLFNFDVLELTEYHPNNFMEAILAAHKAGYDGLMLDSLSAAWAGKGGALELVDQFTAA